MPTINEICNEFESNLRSGMAVDVSDFVEQYSGDTSECLCQLLQIELAVLIQQGKSVFIQPYQQRLSNYPQAVAKAFQEIQTRFPDAAISDADAPQTESVARVRLQVTDGPSAGSELVFDDHQTCVVGRATEAHLRLSPNREFSRYHCRLEINPPKLLIVDLGSTNGTRVNGRRVQTMLLESGDVVSIGDTRFTVIVEKNSPPPEIPTRPDSLTPTFVDTDLPEESFDEQTPDVPGYCIQQRIGQGSMGAVYAARRLATNERVAIKFIRPVMAANGKTLDKFRREAAIILRLQHRRIVRAFDFRITDQQLPYIVMEHIDQVNVEEILARFTLKERCRLACGIISRALEGLHYAHQMEIVHRDVKPSNLLVYRSGRKLQVKLSDFGLAKNFIDAGFSDCSASGEICGTLAYMAPEQIIDCRRAKPSCDIYAAGVCLYRLISNRLPYEAEMVADRISQILNVGPTPLEHHVPSIPKGIAGIVNRALARAPNDRYATANHMLEDLSPFTKRNRP